MAKLLATLPTIYSVNYILDKKGRPLINLEDFCLILDCDLADTFDFFNNLKEKMGSYWSDVDNYTQQKEGWFITVPQAYVLLSESSSLNRINTAKYLLEQTLPKAINQNKLN